MSRRTAAMALFTASVIGVSYLNRSTSAGATSSAGRSAVQLAKAADTDRIEVARVIADLEAQARTQPSAGAFQTLAELYLQRGRLTGDVATYVQAQSAIDEAVRLAPADRASLTIRAGLRFTTHDFAGARDDAAKLVAEKSDDAGALAVLGDAQIELGLYDSAAVTYAKLAAQAPDAAAALVRRARLAFLQGGTGEAIRLADSAKTQAEASRFGDAGLAYYTTVQAQLRFDSGDYEKAAALYERALVESPDFHIALAGLGRARAAQGKLDAAIALYERAVAAIPQPDTVAALGDLYAVRSDSERARANYDTVEVIATLAGVNKQVYNRALAVYYADHNTHVDEALRLAEGELTVRKDVYGYDMVAWARYRNGNFAEAREAATKALALNTRDAKLLYHAALIDRALGNTALAEQELERALAINPKFDPIHAPLAATALAELRTATPGAPK